MRTLTRATLTDVLACIGGVTMIAVVYVVGAAL